jgi:hypothetical protein
MQNVQIERGQLSGTMGVSRSPSAAAVFKQLPDPEAMPRPHQSFSGETEKIGL